MERKLSWVKYTCPRGHKYEYEHELCREGDWEYTRTNKYPACPICGTRTDVVIRGATGRVRRLM